MRRQVRNGSCDCWNEGFASGTDAGTTQRVEAGVSADRYQTCVADDQAIALYKLIKATQRGLLCRLMLSGRSSTGCWKFVAASEL